MSAHYNNYMNAKSAAEACYHQSLYLKELDNRYGPSTGLASKKDSKHVGLAGYIVLGVFLCFVALGVLQALLR